MTVKRINELKHRETQTNRAVKRKKNEKEVKTAYGTCEITSSFPGGSVSKESTYNVGDLSSIPGLGNPPEKGMATHFNILAWRISWTEEPGSMGSQRVGHEHAHTHSTACYVGVSLLHKFCQ